MMKPALLSLLPFTIILALSGCGKKSPADQVGSRIIELLDEAGTTMESIVDIETVDTGGARLIELAREIASLSAEAREMDESPSPKMYGKVEEAQANLQEAVHAMQARLEEDPAAFDKVLPTLVEMKASLENR